ncbi:hypothetical protein [Streptomyces ardesiacus]|uniref:hypothetical protein n=1 Tax=Streptomyces ardesiacus TaxID=285564 RepID=UPI003695DAE9
MPARTLTMPGNTDQFVLTERPALTLTDRSRPLPDGMDHTNLTLVPANQVGSRHEQEEPPMSTTTAKDAIRVATRAFRNGSVRGVRTYLHINCGCRIASSLMGTYDNIEDARRKGAELVEGGDYYRTCSKSGLVKAQALSRSVRYFDDTMQAAASTFNGAGVRDGDVVVVASEGVVAIVIRAAVIAITAKRGHLIGLDTSARTFRDGLYAEIVDRAEAEARKIRATVDPLHAAPAAEEAPAAPATPADVVRTDGVQVKPGPEWGTLKGFAAPFRLWGEEREGGRFAPAFDRMRVTGEPLVIVEVWTTQRGTARHGRDANGREVHLYGGATRFWRAPGA